ncbi:MAG: hypothetical protein ABL974_18440, partial [Prosthecobacter sp.]
NIQGGAVKLVELEGTRCGYLDMAANVSSNQCTFQGMNRAYAGWSLTERNCIHFLSGTLSRNPIGGTVDIQACTFDGRLITSIQGGVPQASLFTREQPLDLVFRNNLVLIPASVLVPAPNVFANLRNTDTLQLSNNAYSLGSSPLVYQYNDGMTTQNQTLPQWQALGFDTASFMSASMSLNGLQPAVGSPLINAGIALGPLTDYSGGEFRLRNDIGAYEAYPTTYALWQAENFTLAEMAQTARVNASSSFLGDGIANVLKYALGLYPGDAASAALPQLTLDLTQPGAPIMRIAYQRTRWAGDLSLELQFSQDLVQWDLVPVANQQVMVTDMSIEQIKAVILPPSSARGFVRLKVALE